MPELANQFYKSLRAGDQEMVNLMIREFFIPFVRLRSKKKGYAVSLIKAGATLIGRTAGNVRAPLVMPEPDEIAELKEIMDRGKKLMSQ